MIWDILHREIRQRWFLRIGFVGVEWRCFLSSTYGMADASLLEPFYRSSVEFLFRTS
ncbi:hypothetical protein CLOSTMETH_00498 [[Clostridium] methylpentosum DSM 5476]|uniref:Uncharacterized protein n=1 Tax=[Clostridium] methylpentosum DSM 5476 TaxID=537013 RepID=C0E9J9_9FIRM|nr:hypothetical protein CLOSTMETH_00498 [[Clostridium] methylpentosum DSM 5476]